MTQTSSTAITDYLTMTINNQMFGIPVLQVQDVLREQKVTRIPLSPPEIEGALNLRGRIVTAVNMRRKLRLDEAGAKSITKRMSVVVEKNQELYSLIIDHVGDVLPLDPEKFESVPATLDPLWLGIATGIYRLDDSLLVLIDVSSLLHTHGPD